jgi:cytochrome c-type biogenesis protein CcmF
MPWLVGTALIHSLAVTDKRGLFKSWTLLLSVLAFSLSLLGTFLVRSGVLVSVHSFAADPARGRFILAFLGIVIGGALTLYAWRAPLLKSNAGFELLSRESFLLFNNILLVVAAATVLGGTLAPLIADTLGQTALSVGPPYFRPTFLLAMVPLLLLLSIGIHASWKRGHLEGASRALVVTLGVAVVLGAAMVFGAFGGKHALAITGLAIGSWIILSSLIDPVDRLRRHLSLSRAVLGMTLAHIGLAVAVIALTGVESYTSEQDIALAPGASANLGGYDFKLLGTQPVEGANYSAIRATVNVSRNGQPIITLYPESRTFWVQQQTRKVAGIYNRYGTDLFIALGDDLGAGRWSFRAQIRPLITLLWLGPLFMALGGALALSDSRYRLARAAAHEPVAGAAQGEAR